MVQCLKFSIVFRVKFYPTFFTGCPNLGTEFVFYNLAHFHRPALIRFVSDLQDFAILFGISAARNFVKQPQKTSMEKGMNWPFPIHPLLICVQRSADICLLQLAETGWLVSGMCSPHLSNFVFVTTSEELEYV